MRYPLKIAKNKKKRDSSKIYRSWPTLEGKNIDIDTPHSAVPVEIIIDQPVFVVIE
jgi:hypothetical protein